MMAYTFYYAPQDPHFGLYFEWPQYQDHLTKTVEVVYKIFKMWRAVKMVESLTPEQQDRMRQKIVSYDIFHGKKPWQFQRLYDGNQLGNSRNQTAMQYKAAEANILRECGDQVVLFSDMVNKVNSAGKSQMRGFALTNRHMVKLDPKNYKVKKDRVEIANVSRISLSPHGKDTFVIIHMKAPDRDLVLDFGCGVLAEDRVSEFVTILYQAVYAANSLPVQVDFSENIKFNNTRKGNKPGKTISVTFGSNTDPKAPTNCVFKKGKDNMAQILYR
eukprot:Colp12_sorted_trinity150504_noHs@22175